MKFSAFPDRAALMRAAADRMAEALRGAIEARGEACIALSGGTTPEPAYRLLAEMRIEWLRVRFALVDERFVPPTHPASNQGMLERALAAALAAGARLIPMASAAPNAATAAAEADALYAPLRLDLALMGMGADGHTASWFPGSAGLDAALDLSGLRSVVAVTAPAAAGAAERLTLTRPALFGAGSLLLLITGDEKRAALEAARTKLYRDAPVRALLEPPAPPLEVLWAA